MFQEDITLIFLSKSHSKYMKSFLKALFVLLLLVSQKPANAADLNVLIIGLSSDDGDVHIALFNDPKNFPYSEGIFSEKKIRIKNSRASCIFKNLKEGPYAIAAYHDKNDNDNFDQNILGIPEEDFGFSNGSSFFFSPPSFDQSKFFIQGSKKSVIITLN